MVGEAYTRKGDKMTPDEAIEILKYHKCPNGNGMDCGRYTCQECHEATDIAIKALKGGVNKDDNR